MRKHSLRRILLSSAATVSGVVLLLALKSPGLPGASSVQAGGAAGVGAGAGPAPTAGAPVAPGGRGSTAPGGQGATAPGGKGSAPGQGAGKQPQGQGAGKQPQGRGTARTVTGEVVRTQYGPVQVEVTVAGGRITKASAVQAPSSTPHSKELTSSAVPRLNRAAVTAQSAHIDAVSGATYTSEGYTRSLQSALDKVGA